MLKRKVIASVWQEGDWYVAQALEPDVASQGESPEAALANLREALELYFEPSHPPAESLALRVELELAAPHPAGSWPGATGCTGGKAANSSPVNSSP